MMKNKVLVAIIFCVEIGALCLWQCKQLLERVHFSSYDLQLRLIESIHNDQLVSLWEVRIFHNKFAGFVFDVIKHYLQFWDFSFLVSMLSLVGVIGVGIMFYYFVSQRKRWFHWVLLLYLLLSPLLEIFQVPVGTPSLRIYLIILPLIIWSVLGYWQFLTHQKRGKKFVIAVLLVSIWYHTALVQINLLCPYP